MSSSSFAVVGGSSAVATHGTPDPLHMMNETEVQETTISELENDLSSYQSLDENTPGTIIFSPQDVRPPLKKQHRPGRPPNSGSKPQTTIPSTFKNTDSVGVGLTAAQQRAENVADEIEKMKDKDSPVACNFCGKVMMSAKTLLQHMSIHAEFKPFRCPSCPKTFTRKVQLQGHLVSHGSEKQFECPICHQRFSRRDCVKIHMRIHDKSKCVFCEVCHKPFLTAGALNIHMRIHRGEKPFKCHLCGKCFTQKNHLITHIRRHTKINDVTYSKKLGYRMFKCVHCPRSFIRLSDYERHVQWNHGTVADVNNMPPPNVLDYDSSDASMSQESGSGQAPRDMVKEKSRGYKRAKKEPVKMCSSSTQTDDSGGHIIIPRQYKHEFKGEGVQHNQRSVSSGTDPNDTPRRDEDTFDPDAFDEGMDRNYSSDEEGDERMDTSEDNQPQQRVFSISSSQSGGVPTSTESAQDAAFDAMVNSTNEVKRVKVSQAETHILPNAIDADEPNERIFIIHNESDSYEPIVTSGDNTKTITQPSSKQSSVYTVKVSTSENKQMFAKHSTVSNTDLNKHIESENFLQMVQNSYENFATNTKPTNNDTPKSRIITEVPNTGFVAPVITTSKKDLQIIDNFMKTVNASAKRGRPRSKITPKKGAAQLHLIRKNMKSFISETHEEAKVKPAPGAQKQQKLVPSPHTVVNNENMTQDDPMNKLSSKRQARKRHGKDFLCTSKSCEICKPHLSSVIDEASGTIINVRNLTPGTVIKNVPTSPKQEEKVIKTERNISELAEGGVKKYVEMYNLLNYGVKDIADLEETRVLVAPPRKVPSSTNAGTGNQSGDVPTTTSANDYQHQPDQMQYIMAKTSASEESIISPPVDVKSFCVPTYSCKLCGREFRFEGKLHRHIDAVHQNKSIFTSDVKPGRGPRVHYTDYEHAGFGDLMPQDEGQSLVLVSDGQEEYEQDPMSVLPNNNEEVVDNPEIEALRSEWDDDDDDDDDEGDDPAIKPSVTKPQPIYSQSALQRIQAQHQLEKQKLLRQQQHKQQQQVMSQQRAIEIVTRNIQPMTTTISDSYSGGVVLNMNKISGIMPKIEPESSNAVESASAQPTIDDKSLDAKCQKLLLKLFNHDLLTKSGLGTDHVSVVLGRILQHYGVKMIEDYGQGQYEVLKYNLWRLMEWKLTIEQMEEFYSDNKTVEEMMDDIMNERVPFVPHEVITEAQEQERANLAHQQVEEMVVQHVDGEQIVVEQQVEGEHVVVHGGEQVLVDQATGQHIVVQGIEHHHHHLQGGTMLDTGVRQHMTGGNRGAGDNSGQQIVLQAVHAGQGEGGSNSDGTTVIMQPMMSDTHQLTEVTQMVLAHDVSPEMLRGAQIVTLDPTTGQLISQVAANPVVQTSADGNTTLVYRMPVDTGSVQDGTPIVVSQEQVVLLQGSGTGHQYVTTSQPSVSTAEGDNS